MNKKYLIPLIAVFVIAGVFAVGYVVNNFVIKSDVYEAFDPVEYAILGDGGVWNGQDTCTDYQGVWTSYENGVEVDVQGLYVGEGRKVCVRINNLAEADIPYVITSTILNEDEETYDKCLTAFGEPSVNGVALRESQTINGVGVIVSTSAEPVDDCLIKVEAKRV